MSWKNPKAEIHVTGWPAIIMFAAIVIAAIHSILYLIEVALR